MEIVEIELEKLKAADYNPRAMTDREARDLETSIELFGMVEPIVVNQYPGREFVIVGGHQRYNILKKRGDKTAPCVFVNLPLEQEKELNLRLNKNLGHWDWTMIKNFEEELLKEVGFSNQELDKYFKETKEDDAPEVDEGTPDSKKGTIYQLGRHRLLCGDSTRSDYIKMLMGGVQADMVFSDPPYGVDYEGKTKKKLHIKNDATTDIFGQVLPNFAESCKPGTSFYICCPAGNNFKAFLLAFEEYCHISSTIIWVKNSMVLGHGDYHYRHEPILYGWLNNGNHKFYGDRKQTTVWEIDRPTVSREHPTMKPLALVGMAVKNSSQPGDIVLDLFGGSGSTLMACEQLDRVCYMAELDPKYCDVIRKRYAISINKADDWIVATPEVVSFVSQKEANDDA